MRNTANFYIRNTMTGIRKSPEERTSLETEVLHDVFTGIQKANWEAEERFLSKLERLAKTGGMKAAVQPSSGPNWYRLFSLIRQKISGF